VRILVVVALAWFGCTSPVRPLQPRPIEEAGFVRIDGIDQWVTIRGADERNPVLLILHGGPGDAQSALRNTYAIYERSFTVVQWDQPGAGRTYGKNPTVVPEPERVVHDGLELTEYLRRRLARRRIVLLGHSWGTHLGIAMVRARPELFSAYVGTGQVGSWRESIQAQFDFLLEHARAAHDQATVDKLEAIGKPDPDDANRYFSWWSIRNPYMASADLAWIAGLRDLAKREPELTDAYMAMVGDGMMFSGKATVGAMVRTELPTTASEIAVPFFVVQGADDMVTPTSVTVHYFDGVRAPIKKLVLVPGAGHFAIVTHRDQFAAALESMVLPVAREADRD
jgi:pimeloyl-ACP methyl ester carboxylesterase